MLRRLRRSMALRAVRRARGTDELQAELLFAGQALRLDEAALAEASGLTVADVRLVLTRGR